MTGMIPDAIKTMPMHLFVLWLASILMAVIIIGLTIKGEASPWTAMAGGLCLANIFWLPMFQLADNLIKKMLDFLGSLPNGKPPIR